MAIPQDLLAEMPYHLASDIAHDHGLGIAIKEAIPKIVRGTPVPTTNEDAVVAHFDDRMETHDEYNQVKEQQQVFELPPSTESLPSKLDWTLPEGSAFVHDAGPKLFKMLGTNNYITYGTILDSATKPRESAVYVEPPAEIPASVFAELGFAPNVGPMKLKKESDTSLKVAMFYYNPKKESKPVLYDMTRIGSRIKEVGEGAVKEMGSPVGYLASVATVKANLRPNNEDTTRYIIGKALGDALQVMSVRDAQQTTPVRLIHNTEDRLNFVRCRVFDVPAVHVGRVTNENPVRICTFVPSRAMITDTPADRFNRYLLKLKGFLQVTASNYDRVIKQFTDPQTTLAPRLRPEYCADAARQIQLLKIGTLFHFMTWYLYYDAKKAAPTEEDAKEIAESHDTLAASAKRLSPYGSITRINGLDYVQKFIICHAPPDDCDLGGFPIVPAGGTNLKERATAIIDVLFGRAPIETITTGNTRLKIDVAGLQALLTEVGIPTQPLVPPPTEVSIPSGGGAGFGIRGTYYLELAQDAKSQKQAPSRTLVGGVSLKREREEEVVEQSSEPPPPAIGTDDIALFEWYVQKHGRGLRSSDILYFIKDFSGRTTAEDGGREANETVLDFGLVAELTDPDGGIVPTPGGDPEKSVALWNAFLCYVNRGILDRGKSNSWVSLHRQLYSDQVVKDLRRQEQMFLQKLQVTVPMDVEPLVRPPVPVPVAAAARRPPPPSGISQKDWDDALDELEARYSR